MNTDLKTRIKRAVLDAEPNAEVVLFGSRARGGANPDSDWDVLVLLKGTVDLTRQERIRSNLFDLELESGAVISAMIRSTDHWRSKRTRTTPFYRNVSREGIPL